MGGWGSTRWGGHVRRRMIGEGTPALPARILAGVVREARQNVPRGSVRSPDKLPNEGPGRGAAERWGGFLHWRGELSAEWLLEELDPSGGLDQPGRSRLTLWPVEMRAEMRVEMREALGGLAGGQVVHLDRVPQPLGGVRWWLRCPTCDRRRGALYLTPATAPRLAFRCRECLGLTYQTKRAAPVDRLYIRARKLARRVGADDPMDPIDRPRGMHRVTFKRRLYELEAVLEERDRVWVEVARRFLERTDGALGARVTGKQ